MVVFKGSLLVIWSMSLYIFSNVSTDCLKIMLSVLECEVYISVVPSVRYGVNVYVVICAM